MKKWYFLNILLFLATVALGQNIEFDTLNVPQYSQTDEFHLNSSGHIFTSIENYSEDGGTTWSTPDWGQLKTTNEGPNFYDDFGAFHLKYNLEDLSVDTLPIFDSPSRGAVSHLFSDKAGNTYCLNNRSEIYVFSLGGNSWNLIVSYWQQPDRQNLGGVRVFSNNDYLYYVHSGINYRCDKFDGSGLIEVENLPTFQHSTGKLITIRVKEYFLSEDEGLTWLPFDKLPINTLEISHFNSAPSGKLMILDKENSIYTSDNFGQTWTSNSNSIPEVEFGYRGNGSSFYPQIDFSEQRNEYFLITAANFNTNFFMLSSNIQSYTPIYSNLQSERVSNIFDDFAGNIYLKTEQLYKKNTFYQSTDQGENFNSFTINGEKHTSSIVSLRNAPTLFAKIGTTIYRSIDAGTTWETLPVQGTIKVGYGDQINLYDLDRINHVSTDNGDSWHQIGKDIIFGQDGNFYRYAFTADTLQCLHRYELALGIWHPLDTLDNTDELSTGLFISERGTIFWSTSTIGNSTWEEDLFVSYDQGKSFTEYHFSDNSNDDLSSWYSYKNELFNEGSFRTNSIQLSQDEGLTWGNFFPNSFLTTLTVSSFGNIYLRDYWGYAPLLRLKNPISDFKTLKGKTFIDRDQNCLENTGEEPIKNAIIKLSENGKNYYSTTNQEGEYLFYLPEGDFEVSTTYNSIFAEACDSTISVSISANQQEVTADFPIKFTKDCPYLSVDLSTPRIRRCFENTHFVSVKNEGTLHADSAYVQINIDSRFEITDASLPWVKDLDGLYNFFIGTIDIFEKEQFRFTTIHSCDSVQLMETICMEAQVFPNDGCGEMADWQGPTLKVDGYCDGDSLRFKVKNIGDDDMTQARQYIIIEDVAIMRIGDPFQLPSGGDIEIPVEATGQTVHVEIPQIEGHPDQSNPSITIEGCGSGTPTLGLFNQFAQNDGLPSVDIECHEVIGAYDPNDKSAIPVGIDAEHKIQPNNSIDYLIRFQNTGTDTAFTVIVVDTLSQWLDIPSFQPGASSHLYEYEITDHGTVRFIFNNIMLPDSNINEVASNGFVKYKIAMKTDLPLGTEILNEADIYFDFNDPIRTNETFHVVDEPWVLVKTSEVFVPNVSVNLYPNPFSESAILELKTEGKTIEFNCQIFDLSGRLISSQDSKNQKIQISRNGMKAGFYFYKMRNANGDIASGKLVVK